MSERTLQQLNQTIGLNVKHYRILRGLTQKDFAQQVGMATITVGSIERGIANPTVKMLYSMAEKLDVSFLDLVTDEKTICFSKDILLKTLKEKK